MSLMFGVFFISISFFLVLSFHKKSKLISLQLGLNHQKNFRIKLKKYKILHSLLLPIFGFPQNKKNKNEKIKKYISKNIQRKSKNNRSEKRMLKCWKRGRNWLRRFKNTRIEILTIYFWLMRVLGQGKFNLRKQSPKSDVYGLN
jgi:hypothetical protein